MAESEQQDAFSWKVAATDLQISFPKLPFLTPNSYFLTVPVYALLCTETHMKSQNRYYWLHFQPIKGCLTVNFYPGWRVVVNRQPDTTAAFPRERKNWSAPPQISNAESLLGITFLSSCFSPTCPFTQHFLASAAFHVFRLRSAESGSWKNPTSYQFFKDRLEHKLPAECRKMWHDCTHCQCRRWNVDTSFPFTVWWKITVWNTTVHFVECILLFSLTDWH